MKTEPQRALTALLLLLPAPSLGTAAAMFWWPELMIGKALFVFSKLWLVALPVVWLRFVDRAPLSWSPPRQGGFGIAIASGVLISAIIAVLYFAATRLNALDSAAIAERAARTGLDQPLIYWAGAVYWITLNSAMEEYVWRWFVFRKFEVLWGKTAVVASALAFTAHHVVALAAQFNTAITILGSVGVFIGGLTWSWLYLRYRSIWPGYVSHAIVDAALFIIGYRLIFQSA